MTISKELFLSILAMDSYNRGYDAGVADGGTGDPDGLGEAGYLIGSATVLTADLPAGAQAAGFYAVAYSIGGGGPAGLAGKTLISYRGTDNLSLNPNSASDIFNGWVLGAGQLTDQSRMALEFFRSVVGQEIGEIVGGTHPGLMLTGHSLGGGLAELVSMLTNTEAVGFDHMPAGLAAVTQAAANSCTEPM